MEPNIERTLGEMEAKIDAIYASTEKTRRNSQIMMWLSVAMVVLPLIGLVIAVPIFLSTYASALDGLL